MKRLSPAPSKPAVSAREVTRNVYCTHYGTCLDHAIRNDWEGFTCKECPGYEREQLSAEDAFEECVRCAALVYLITYPDTAMNSCGLFSNSGRKPRKMKSCWAAVPETACEPACA